MEMGLDRHHWRTDNGDENEEFRPYLGQIERVETNVDGGGGGRYVVFCTNLWVKFLYIAHQRPDVVNMTFDKFPE